jgi:hypothetical protein
MGGLLREAALKRATGKRPSPLRALLASMIAGAGAARLTYRVLRK